MRFSVEKLFRLVKGEFKTDLGKYNAFSTILLCFVFGGLQVKYLVTHIPIIFSSYKIAPGNTDKFLYFIGIYFLISLILLAFRSK